MNQYIAIYARKSVERADSISIESQIEFCQYEARGDVYKVYSDNGYSGKNTDRPSFNKMMDDIKHGKIRAVVVYKLDRISRSILDFSEMMEQFQKCGVQFISATEKFDTSSPMGRAMLNICIVFAQLERETIQQRVTDAYYSRLKKGFYMGGKIPYGFALQDVTINGIRTSMYTPVPDEIADIKMIYNMYAQPHHTLGDVLRAVQSLPKNGRRDKVWTTSRLSDLMKNPVYCKADHSIYQFYKSQNSNIHNPPEDFIGTNALYLFKGTTNNNKKSVDLSGRDVVIAPHEGVIDAKTWLFCRKRLLTNQHITYGKANNSWLVGLVKCGKCGYSMSLKKSARKDGVIRYFCCYLKTAAKRCDGAGRTVRVSQLEDSIKHELEQKITFLSITAPIQNRTANKRLDEYKVQIDKIDSEIELLIEQIPNATVAVMQHINNKVTELDAQKSEIERNITNIQDNTNIKYITKLENCMQLWDKLSFDDKVSVARLLIERIYIYPDHTHIEWNV